MNTKDVTRTPPTLVFKLMALILLLSAATAGGFYWISSRQLGEYIHQTIFPNLQQHVVYLIQDIRVNPAPAYVSARAKQLNMDIAISDASSFWSSNASLNQDTLELIQTKIQKRRHSRKGRKDRKGRPQCTETNEEDCYDRKRHSANEPKREHDRHKKPRKNHPNPNLFLPVLSSYERDEEDEEFEHTPWSQLSRRHPSLRAGTLLSLRIDDRPAIVFREKDQQITVIFNSPIRPFTSYDYLKLLGWLLFLTLITFVILYRMMRPLKDLREGVQAIEEGRYNIIIKQRSKDEIGRLIRSFNSMSTSIREQIQRKEQLLFDMSHELRSPLARIKVALEFLPRSNAKKLISSDIVEQEAIIEELLETARLKNKEMVLNLQTIDVVDLIQKLIQKRKQKTITYTGESTSLNLEIDPPRIQRVINNIIDNALKYAPKNSPIIVSCSKHTSYFMVQIIDQGPGINELDKEHIFEPFYRLDSSRTKATGGFGLGLSMARQIIHAHKGQIYVENRDKGLTVICKLPYTHTITHTTTRYHHA